MWSQDNSVSCLQSHVGLNDRSSFSVCYRHDTSNNAHRLSPFLHSSFFIIFDQANGFLTLHLEISSPNLTIDLTNLVFRDTHAGFFNQHFSIHLSLFRLSEVVSNSSSDQINIFLCEVVCDSLCFSCFFY